ncbi:hypothetical protein CFOL_v3_12999 [Cephalotus follicularis]|uniref:F-box associated beta-propeller type 1 domain-containing protein n=1 Tax=Cephalotus follicularis TaxID=3775 RepID=A0A1Q3BNM3_CEPFO|nr:hypothetical protein CFOL_v3_12999 [Cephalotus follicularis]
MMDIIPIYNSEESDEENVEFDFGEAEEIEQLNVNSFYESSKKRRRTPEDDAKFPKNIKLKEDLTIDDVVRQHTLPLLPAKSLCRFKTVSKEWETRIMSPFLAHQQSNNFKDISGLFCQSPGEDPSFISFDQDAYGVPSPSLNFLPEHVNIRSTCNGLVCCGSYPGNERYYICNPVTRKWKELPEPILYHGPEVAVALAFEPATFNFDANYELVCAIILPDYPVVYFEIYSSRTSSWRVSNTTCRELDFFKLRSDGFYWKGNIYWETSSGAVLAFDLKYEEYGILPCPMSIDPNGVFTELHGELCYILPQVQDDACTVLVYGNLDMSLKSVIALDPQALGYIDDRLVRVLTCINNDTLIITLRNGVYAYNVTYQRKKFLSSNSGYAKYLPYVNSLATVGSV